MNRHLHIIMHDVPYPVDFGGVFDLYYKLKYLHEAGISVHLHCFVSKRPPQPELEKYCESVHYYKRKKIGISFSLPYIVSSRSSADLIKNLQRDDHPVLLEGIHCTYPLFSGALAGRKVFLRLHNTEFKYYEQLAKHESNLLKRLYFFTESRLLKKYEAGIANKAFIIAVSETDLSIYEQEFDAKQIIFFPVFLPQQDITSAAGKGKYCLYNGNLSVNENEKAALWLIEEIFSKSRIPLIIAGKSPAAKLRTAAKKYDHISIIADPSELKMQELIKEAAVNVLPSMNATGVKLKLLNALFNGRHCLTNMAGSEGSGAEQLCETTDDADSFLKKTDELFHSAFTEADIEKRRSALKLIYNNELNVRKLIGLIGY